VYCVGSFSDLVEVYDTVGAPLEPLLLRQPGEVGLIDIKDIDMDTHGHLYAVDSENKRVRVCEDSTGFLTSFGVSGTEVGRFDAILGLAISPTGMIAISDHAAIHLIRSPF